MTRQCVRVSQPRDPLARSCQRGTSLKACSATLHLPATGSLQSRKDASSRDRGPPHCRTSGDQTLHKPFESGSSSTRIVMTDNGPSMNKQTKETKKKRFIFKKMYLAGFPTRCKKHDDCKDTPYPWYCSFYLSKLNIL